MVAPHPEFSLSNSPALVVDVVGIAVVGGAKCDHRFECRAVAWPRPGGLLKPPQEMPIVPTRPLHQGCRRAQAITRQASSSSCSLLFVLHQPF